MHEEKTGCHMDALRRQAWKLVRSYEIDAEVPTEKSMPESKLSAANAAELADIVNEYKSFIEYAEEVDEIVDGDDPFLRDDYDNDRVRIRSTTPRTFLEIGCSQLPVDITEGHLWRILAPDEHNKGLHHQHGIAIDTAKQLPLLLEEPVLIANHPTDRMRLIAVMDALDGNGLPIIVPIEPNARKPMEVGGEITNLVLSVFGKTRFTNYFGSAISADNVLLISSTAEKSLSAKFGGDVLANYRDLARDRPLAQGRFAGTKRIDEQPRIEMHVQMESAEHHKENRN